jgi:membrane protease YdiL (CAAX protease family)
LVARSLSKVGNWRLFLKKYGIWIVILASLNSFSEELIYRGSLITVMEGDFPHWFIAIISGIVFMLAHIKGQVKGLFVLLGSAFIGWCLAYVVLQTQGLFWAWAIHFIQDLLIFSAFLVNTKQSKSSVVQPS